MMFVVVVVVVCVDVAGGSCCSGCFQRYCHGRFLFPANVSGVAAEVDRVILSEKELVEVLDDQNAPMIGLHCCCCCCCCYDEQMNAAFQQWYVRLLLQLAS